MERRVLAAKQWKDRVIRAKGHRCHVFRKYLALVKRQGTYGERIAVKAAGPDTDALCQTWSGPFVRVVRSPHRFVTPSKSMTWNDDVKLLGIFRDTLVLEYRSTHQGGLLLVDLIGPKERVLTSFLPGSEFKYEGDCRFTL